MHEVTARASEREESTKAVRYPPGRQQSAVTGIDRPGETSYGSGRVILRD